MFHPKGLTGSLEEVLAMAFLTGVAIPDEQVLDVSADLQEDSRPVPSFNHAMLTLKRKSSIVSDPA